MYWKVRIVDEVLASTKRHSQVMWLSPVAAGGGASTWESPHSVSLFLILAETYGLVPFSERGEWDEGGKEWRMNIQERLLTAFLDCYADYGLRTRSICNPWELVGNAESQIPPQTCRIRSCFFFFFRSCFLTKFLGEFV